jgi:hypothetical protein
MRPTHYGIIKPCNAFFESPDCKHYHLQNKVLRLKICSTTSFDPSFHILNKYGLNYLMTRLRLGPSLYIFKSKTEMKKVLRKLNG